LQGGNTCFRYLKITDACSVYVHVWLYKEQYETMTPLIAQIRLKDHSSSSKAEAMVILTIIHKGKY